MVAHEFFVVVLGLSLAAMSGGHSPGELRGLLVAVGSLVVELGSRVHSLR